MIADRLRETFFFFRTNAGGLAAVTLPFAALASASTHLVGEPFVIEGERAVMHWQAVAGLVVLYPLALGVKLLGIHALATQQRLPPPGRLLTAAIRCWLPLLAVSVAIAVAMVIGLYLFVLPGIWLYARLALAPLLVTVEGIGPAEALRRSWQQTKPLQQELLGVAFLVGGGVVFVLLVFFQLIAAAGAEASVTADLLARGLGEWLFCLPSIAFYRYWSLAQEQEQEQEPT